MTSGGPAAYKRSPDSPADGEAVSARVRKLIGLVGILAILSGYVWLATAIAEHLPENALIQVIYYAVAGLAWGVPVLPLISWMNRGR